MAFKFKSGSGLKNVMQEEFLLRSNPFSSASIYDPANPGSYEPGCMALIMKSSTGSSFCCP